MSGGVETERVRDVGGGGGGGELGGGGGGGSTGGIREGGGALVSHLPPTTTVVSTTSAASSQNHTTTTGPPNNSQQQGQNNNNGGNGRRAHRRLRRHHHQQNHRKQNHYAKRIRRNTQSAPNNNNEFLMQEHDHLYHLDFENEDWEGSHHQLGMDPSSALNNNNNNPSMPFYSSSEDDEDYLSREFSATYDTVNAERLSSMTKAELISEYQLLQDRVETLERRLKGAIVAKHSEIGLIGAPGGEVIEGGRVTGDEILKLKEENQQIKSHNQYLRRLMIRAHRVGGGGGGQPTPPAPQPPQNLIVVAELEEMEADQGSTDSGGLGR